MSLTKCMHKCCYGIIIINSKLSLKRCFKNSPIFSCSKVFFFSFHTQQRICCRAILPKILLTLEMPHYYHWFSVKNHNHLIHTMWGYICIMGFCAFLLLKSCHCCWGNPFPRSINHKVQQHNNINMWRPDNSDWPDVALVENSLTKLIFFRP